MADALAATGATVVLTADRLGRGELADVVVVRRRWPPRGELLDCAGQRRHEVEDG